MLPLVLFAMSLSAGSPNVPSSRSIDLTDRTPAWVDVEVAEAGGLFASPSELFDLVGGRLEARTTLAPLRLVEGRLDACLAKEPAPSRTTCLVLAARAADVPLVFLAVVSGDQLRLRVVDVKAAGDEVAEALEGRAAEATPEARVTAADTAALAALRRVPPQAVRSAEEVERALERALEQAPLSSIVPLAARETAELRVRAEPADTELTLDERPLGLAGEGALRVRGLRPGPHRLFATHPELEPAERAFELAPGEQLELALELRRDYGGAWDGMAWTGVALVLGGAAATIVGFSEVSGRSSPRNADIGLIRIFPGSGGAPAVGSDLVGEGPIVAGLASGLFVSGGLLGALGVFGRDESRPPWLELLLGVGAGVVTYAVFEGIALAD